MAKLMKELPVDTVFNINEPAWIKWLYGTMKPFLSKRIQGQIKFLKTTDDLYSELGGIDFLPEFLSGNRVSQKLDF